MPESFERCFKANITRLNAFKNISRSVFARGCADRCDASGILHCEEHAFVMLISRECYQCISTHSWGACDAKRYKVRCLTSQSCLKASAKVPLKKFISKAAPQNLLSIRIPVCSEPGVKCEVDCCKTDYCNGAPGRMVSGLLLMACVPIATGVISLFSY
ncbi:hypothetical protein OS493_003574 [Desmophyllum pertusum]|uniref:Uncharacterized protein n=1 Tax=Desmophyllum pertusum TaxID=174260 RepID=A0A9X0A6F5_9CNID|nr:hypothetical protein OS493_003574 [Desmophyllum pertusum]